MDDHCGSVTPVVILPHESVIVLVTNPLPMAPPRDPNGDGSAGARGGSFSSTATPLHGGASLPRPVRWTPAAETAPLGSGRRPLEWRSGGRRIRSDCHRRRAGYPGPRHPGGALETSGCPGMPPKNQSRTADPPMQPPAGPPAHVQTPWTARHSSRVHPRTTWISVT
jgi:hypothetical protein